MSVIVGAKLLTVVQEVSDDLVPLNPLPYLLSCLLLQAGCLFLFLEHSLTLGPYTTCSLTGLSPAVSMAHPSLPSGLIQMSPLREAFPGRRI